MCLEDTRLEGVSFPLDGSRFDARVYLGIKGLFFSAIEIVWFCDFFFASRRLPCRGALFSRGVRGRPAGVSRRGFHLRSEKRYLEESGIGCREGRLVVEKILLQGIL